MSSEQETAFDEERSEREVQAWDVFRNWMNSLGTLEDARALLENPPVDAGHQYYLNLAELMLMSAVPKQASLEERALYLAFLERLNANGEFASCTNSVLISGLRRTLGQ